VADHPRGWKRRRAERPASLRGDRGSRLPLALDCRATSSLAEVGAARGIAVDLRSADERDAKLAWLASSIERLVLRADDRRPR
jgi:hypothetical protein